MNLSAPRKLLGFGGPIHRLDQKLAEEIVVEYAHAYVGRFLEVYGPRLHSSLQSVVKSWAANSSTFEECWDVTLAECRRAVLSPAAFSARRISHTAAGFALRAASFGRSVDFESDLDPGLRLRLGPWLLPAAERVALDCDGRTLRLKMSRNGRSASVVFRHARQRWVCESIDPLPELAIGAGRCAMLPSKAWSGLYLTDWSSRQTRVPIDECTTQLDRALQLLKRRTPRFVPWVSRVLRSVMCCEGKIGTLRSGSDFNLPGILQISFPAIPAAHAEMLVHECAHQHFQILTRLGDVDDGSDKTPYYSPIKRTGRPISRILLTYHAFANVVLFYRDCRAAGVRDGGYCERNERNMLPQLQRLEEALRTTKALTPLGRALWEPLSAAIW